MDFVNPCLKSRDIRFSVGESLGGDHLPIEIFLDRPLQRNIPITSSRCQFAEVDINTFQNKMVVIFNSNFFYSFTPKASNMDKCQKHLVDSMKEPADTSFPKLDYREKPDKVKINKDTLKLILWKGTLRSSACTNFADTNRREINQFVSIHTYSHHLTQPMTVFMTKTITTRS